MRLHVIRAAPPQRREIVQLYNKWFQQRLPTGETLDLPMSPQLEEVFRVEGVAD